MTKITIQASASNESRTITSVSDPRTTGQEIRAGQDFLRKADRLIKHLQREKGEMQYIIDELKEKIILLQKDLEYYHDSKEKWKTRANPEYYETGRDVMLKLQDIYQTEKETSERLREQVSVLSQSDTKKDAIIKELQDQLKIEKEKRPKKKLLLRKRKMATDMDISAASTNQQP